MLTVTPRDAAGAPRGAGPTRPGRGAGASSQRLAWVSWLRAVGILGVVAIHSYMLLALHPAARRSLGGTLAIVVDFACTFAVPAFIMLAGTMALDPARFRGTEHYLRKRMKRVILPLVVWHAVYLVLVPALNPARRDLRDLLGRVLTGSLAPQLYFFWIILGLSLLTPLLVRWTGQASRREVLVTGAGLALVAPVALVLSPLLPRSVPPLSNHALTWSLGYLGFYVLGYALRDVRLRGGWLPLTVAGFVLGHAVGIWEFNNRAAPWWANTVLQTRYQNIAGLVCGVTAFLLARALVADDGLLAGLGRGRLGRVGSFLGDASMGIFAIHWAVLLVILRFELIGPVPGTFAQATLRMIVAVAVSLLLTVAFRRVPFLRLLV